MTLVAAVLGPVVALGLTLLVGSALTARWDTIKKHRELDLAALEEFYSLCGDFFELWKRWDYAKLHASGEGRAQLTEKIAASEGRLEALLVRVSTQRDLTSEALKTLGDFRQVFQALRTAMREDVALQKLGGWSGSEDVEYATFKRLAAEVAVILRPIHIRLIEKTKWPDSLTATRSLRTITGSAFEAESEPGSR